MRRRIILVLSTILVSGGLLAGMVSVATRSADAPARAELALETREDLNAPSVNRDLPIEDSEVIAHGTVYSKLYIELTDDEIRSIDLEAPRFFNRIVLIGWQREGNRFFRMVPARDVTLRLAGEVINIKNGRYAFVAEEAVAPEQRQEFKGMLHGRNKNAITNAEEGVVPFALSVQGVDIPPAELEVTNIDLGADESSPVRMDIVQNIEYRALKAEMNHAHGVHAQSTSPMERCMDYNGPMSDGRNYKPYDPRAWVNFVCSDCDLAGAGRCVSCWNDHRVKSCQGNHGKVCSNYIGHSSSYHKHKWSQCKYCI